MSTEQPLTTISSPPIKKPVFLIRYFTIAYGILWLIAAVPKYLVYNWYWKHSVGLAIFYIVMSVCMILMFFWLYRLDKKGWVLLMLNFTYNVVALIYVMIKNNMKTAVLYKESNWVYIFFLFLCALVFYFFNRKHVLNAFTVNGRFQLITFLFCLPAVVLYIEINKSAANLNYYYGLIN